MHNLLSRKLKPTLKYYSMQHCSLFATEGLHNKRINGMRCIVLHGIIDIHVGNSLRNVKLHGIQKFTEMY